VDYEDPRAVDALIDLSHDQDAQVRDWATFALGEQIPLDTPVVREALADRLADPDDETRHEAIMGLALRGDRRVIPIIARELASDSVHYLAVEAATAMPNPQFYPLLLALRDVALRKSSGAADESTVTWQIAEIDAAVEACSPPVSRGKQQEDHDKS
jgi:HEAT repeat protein